jgi:hypothetical protein
MWREFMDVALASRTPESFPQPQINTAGVKPIISGNYVDSQMIIEAMTSSGTTTPNLSLITENIHNILHFVQRDNPLGPRPANPRNDPQYNNWEYSVQRWKERTYGTLLGNVSVGEIDTNPEESDDGTDD